MPDSSDVHRGPKWLRGVTEQGGGLTTVIHTYDWDAADRLTRAQVDTGGNVKTIEYAYNAAGLRVRRVDTSTNVTKLYSYQGDNLASIQKSQSGAYTANEWVYTVAPGMISNALERHQVSSDGGATTSQYYQYDHRGNVVAVTDSTGDIQYGYQYDAFGSITFSFDEGGTTALTDDLLFTGKDYDEDTGLYYFNARWYDSSAGVFLSRSPLRADTEAPYSYCDGNPLRYVDPLGLATAEDCQKAYEACRDKAWADWRGWTADENRRHKVALEILTCRHDENLKDIRDWADQESSECDIIEHPVARMLCKRSIDVASGIMQGAAWNAYFAAVAVEYAWHVFHMNTLAEILQDRLDECACERRKCRANVDDG